MDDKLIVSLFFERDERALSEVKTKYSRLYRSMLREALNDESDIEECENDVLVALWNSIPPNAPDDLASFICKIARRIGINRYKYNTREKRGGGYTVMLSELEDTIPDRTPEANIGFEDGEAVKKIISEFLASLDKETRVLFVRRYFYMESVGSLAERFEMKENAISVRLSRARKKLKQMLMKEGIYV